MADNDRENSGVEVPTGTITVTFKPGTENPKALLERFVASGERRVKSHVTGTRIETGAVSADNLAMIERLTAELEEARKAAEDSGIDAHREATAALQTLSEKIATVEQGLKSERSRSNLANLVSKSTAHAHEAIQKLETELGQLRIKRQEIIDEAQRHKRRCKQLVREIAGLEEKREAATASLKSDVEAELAGLAKQRDDARNEAAAEKAALEQELNEGIRERVRVARIAEQDLEKQITTLRTQRQATEDSLERLNGMVARAETTLADTQSRADDIRSTIRTRLQQELAGTRAALEAREEEIARREAELAQREAVIESEAEARAAEAVLAATWERQSDVARLRSEAAQMRAAISEARERLDALLPVTVSQKPGALVDLTVALLQNPADTVAFEREALVHLLLSAGKNGRDDAAFREWLAGLRADGHDLLASTVAASGDAIEKARIAAQVVGGMQSPLYQALALGDAAKVTREQGDAAALHDAAMVLTGPWIDGHENGWLNTSRLAGLQLARRNDDMAWLAGDSTILPDPKSGRAHDLIAALSERSDMHLLSPETLFAMSNVWWCRFRDGNLEVSGADVGAIRVKSTREEAEALLDRGLPGMLRDGSVLFSLGTFGGFLYRNCDLIARFCRPDGQKHDGFQISEECAISLLCQPRMVQLENYVHVRIDHLMAMHAPGSGDGREITVFSLPMGWGSGQRFSNPYVQDAVRTLSENAGFVRTGDWLFNRAMISEVERSSSYTIVRVAGRNIRIDENALDAFDELANLPGFVRLRDNRAINVANLQWGHVNEADNRISLASPDWHISMTAPANVCSAIKRIMQEDKGFFCVGADIWIRPAGCNAMVIRPDGLHLGNGMIPADLLPAQNHLREAIEVAVEKTRELEMDNRQMAAATDPAMRGISRILNRTMQAQPR